MTMIEIPETGDVIEVRGDLHVLVRLSERPAVGLVGHDRLDGTPGSMRAHRAYLFYETETDGRWVFVAATVIGPYLDEDDNEVITGSGVNIMRREFEADKPHIPAWLTEYGAKHLPPQSADVVALQRRITELENARDRLVDRMRAGQHWRDGRLVSESRFGQNELRDILGIPLVRPAADTASVTG